MSDRSTGWLTHDDYTNIGGLIDQHMSSLRNDIKWMKGLSAFSLTIVGGGIALIAPMLVDLHRSLDDIRSRVLLLEKNDILNQRINDKVMTRSADHSKCHYPQTRSR